MQLDGSHQRGYQATYHYLNQSWPSSLTHIFNTRPQSAHINDAKPELLKSPSNAFRLYVSQKCCNCICSGWLSIRFMTVMQFCYIFGRMEILIPITNLFYGYDIILQHFRNVEILICLLIIIIELLIMISFRTTRSRVYAASSLEALVNYDVMFFSVLCPYVHWCLPSTMCLPKARWRYWVCCAGPLSYRRHVVSQFFMIPQKRSRNCSRI